MDETPSLIWARSHRSSRPRKTCAESMMREKKKNGQVLFMNWTVLTNCRNVINQTPRSFCRLLLNPSKSRQNDEPISDYFLNYSCAYSLSPSKICVFLFFKFLDIINSLFLVIKKDPCNIFSSQSFLPLFPLFPFFFHAKRKEWKKNGDWYLSSPKHKRGDKQHDHKKMKKKSTNLFFFCQNLFRLILFASSSWRLLNELAKFRELSKKSQKTLI